MRPFRTIIAIVCGLVGLVWIGQGVGLMRGSFITGQPPWAVIGAVLVGLALWQAVALARR